MDIAQQWNNAANVLVALVTTYGPRVLGAVIMQSLRSGMVLLKVDSPTQDVVVGLVLIVAVGLDSTLRKGAK